jgi:Ca2+-binding EF-hand superfamily protein
LKALGKTDEEIATMVSDPPSEEVTLDDFKAIVSPSRLPSGKTVDDTPVIGVFSSAFADAFGLCKHGKVPTDEQMEEAFNKFDTNKSGTLDKTEIAEALRHTGKSERQVQKLIDALPDKEIDLQGFKDMLNPPAKPWMTSIGPVPIPNREKLLDCPGLGHVMSFTGHLLSEPTDHTARKLKQNQGMTDEQLEKAFKQWDTNQDGRLEKKEIADALRTKGAHTEAYIKDILENMKGESMSLFKFKKAMRGPKYQPSNLNYVPAVGESFSTHVIGGEDYSDEDLKEAFDDILEDHKKKDKIDATELAYLLVELGMSDHMVQKKVDECPPGEEFDFEGFKALLEPKARPMTTESGMPNPAKIHDVPVLGTFTQFTQDSVVGAYSYTVGAAMKKFKPPSDEVLKEKWDEIDTKKSGTLNKKDLAKVLRSLGETEKMIMQSLDSMEKDTITFDDYKILVKGPPPKEEPAAATAA